MNIPHNLFIIIDIFICLIILFNILKSFKNGFIYELLNLVFLLLSFILAWIFAPAIANRVGFIFIKSPIEGYLDVTSLNVMINTIVWLVIIVVASNLLFIFIRPVFKSFSKIPVLGFINKLLGVFIGLINALIVCLLLSTLLTLPIFSNGNEVKNGTLFRYCDNVSKEVTKFMVTNINLSKIQSEVDSFDVEKTRTDVLNWLVSQGILDE